MDPKTISNFREFAVMFAEADTNADGRIDFQEFSAMMILPALTRTFA